VLARGCRTLIAQYRRDLEAQLQQQEARQEVARVRKAYPVFAKYPSTEALAALMRQRGPAFYEDKDAVLRAILAEIRRELDAKQKPLLFALLNVVFWDSLCCTFWRKVPSCPDAEDLFVRVQADFYQVAATYPLDHRPRKIDVNLILDTKKKVTVWQREEARYREQYRPLGPAHERGLVPADVQESNVFPEAMEAYLLDLLYRKVIDETQYDLLLEMDVYKRMSQKEWAKAHGVDYDTARSWRYRAEKAIQEFAKAHQERGEREALAPGTSLL